MTQRTLAIPLVIATISCGGISRSTPDASIIDASSNDASPDSSQQSIRTAVAADAISPFTLPNVTFARIPFSSVAYDDKHEFSTDSGRFTATHIGDYHICVSLVTGPNVTFELDLYINGVREKAFAHGTYVANGCRTVRLNPQDFVEVWAYQTSGSPQTIANDPSGDWITIQEEPAQAAITGTTQFMVLSGIFTKIPYKSKIYDDNNEFDSTTGQFLASTAGDYEFCASLAGITVLFELDLFKNDVRERALALGTGAATGCRVLRLTAGDRVTVQIFQAISASVTVTSDSFWNWLNVRRVVADTSIGNTASFNLPATTFVTVPYAIELNDDHNRFNPATHRYTVNSSGDYEVCASILGINSTDLLELDLIKSGVREKLISRRGGAPDGCRVVRARSSDELEVQVYSSAIDSAAMNSNVFWNWLTIRAIQ